MEINATETQKIKELYARWLVEGNARPFKEVHFLWEFRDVPTHNNPEAEPPIYPLTVEDELDVLEMFVKNKRKELENQQQIREPHLIDRQTPQGESRWN